MIDCFVYNEHNPGLQWKLSSDVVQWVLNMKVCWLIEDIIVKEMFLVELKCWDNTQNMCIITLCKPVVIIEWEANQ